MKFKLFLLFTMLLTLFWSTDVMADTAKDTVTVSTPQEFISALSTYKSSSTTVVKITADLDFSGYKYDNVDATGLEITGLKDEYKNVESKDLPDGVVPFYTLSNLGYKVIDDANNINMHHLLFSGTTATLIKKAKNSSFSQIAFEDCGSEDTPCFLTIEDYNCTYEGLIFVGCNAFSKHNDSGVGTYSYDPVGLIASLTKKSTATYCMATGTNILYSDCGQCGSFFGASYGLKMEHCVSSAVVMGYGDSLGGMVGSTSDSYSGTDYGESSFNECTFNGMVKHIDFDDSYDNFTSAVAKANDQAKYMLLWTPLSAALTAVTMVSTFTAQATLAASLVEHVWSLKLLVTQLADTGMAGRALGLASSFFNNLTLCYAFCAINYIYFAYSMYSFCADLGEWLDNISGPDQVGGIAGYAKSAKFTNCSNYGMVYSLDAYSGGIVGYGCGNLDIDDCLNAGAVHGLEQVGGIIGYSWTTYDLNISDCLNIGNISCQDKSTAGKFIGDWSWINYTCDNPYVRPYLYRCCAVDSISADAGSGDRDYRKVTMKQLVTGEIADYLNWGQNVGHDYYPCHGHDFTGVDSSVCDTLKVSNAAELTSALVNSYANIVLTADIDMSGSNAFNLSSSYMPFCGSIDGQGHTISNISFSQTGKTFTFGGIESLWTTEKWVGLLGGAEGATFKNFNLKNCTLDMGTNISNGAIFVGHSKNCTYDNIHITGSSSVCESDGDDHYEEIIGGLIGGSENDVITNCSLGSECSIYNSGYSVGTLYLFKGDDDWALTGGLVGWAKGTTITDCANYGSVTLGSLNRFMGGIVGKIENGKLLRCYNAGTITGSYYTGGITGYTKNTTVSKCTNTGDLKFCGWGITADECDLITRLRESGAVVGTLGSGSTIDNCMNFGTISSAVGCDNICLTESSGKKLSGNYYYSTYDGNHKDNENDYSDDSYYRYAKMMSGEAALNLADADGNHWLYQDIDNNIYTTKWPVPIATAGTVYSNILCNGTQSYSNIYKSTGKHSSSPDQYGKCTVCGYQAQTAGTAIHIKDSLELIAFSKAVNSGTDFSNTTVILDNDINLESINFPIIGRYATHPFRGTFDGNGHRIKNLTLSYAEGGIGFFGVVSGTSTIKNLIIDCSCSITSTAGSGVAGLIGSVKPYNGVAATVNIENCGNEATVTGYNNVAGLLGGVYENNASVVNINNCYNIGSISGTSKSESGSIVGYARKHTNISNTYNAGTVGGTTDWLTFAFTGADDFDGTITNCYTTVSGDKTPGVTKITTDMVITGELCTMLNKTSNVFAQTRGTDVYPVPGTTGLEGSSDPIHITTAEELVAEANYVLQGYSTAGTTFYLDNDIDMTGVEFSGIGNSTYPFKGVFDGQGHRIKNWNASFNGGGGHGFFGCVAGSSCIIKNLIIDSSCSIKVNGDYPGVAGIVGYVSSTSGSTCNVTIENCGNEATITGEDNAAGILGGVYNNTSTKLTISNCYNKGAINGDYHAATLCAVANCNYTFTNCYNSGSLKGVRDKNYLYYKGSGSGSVSNCYDVNGSQTGVTKISSDMISSGELCNLLNSADTVFTQDIATTGTYPVPGTEGLIGTCNLHITTAAELVDFANDVNNGNDYASATIYLNNDIDLSGVSFPVIGRWRSNPFKGTFDGQGHRIKNMTLNFSEEGIGFFGCVAGVCTIKNLIIDSSCSVTSKDHQAVAGIVGKLETDNGSNIITIENCGNEATVTGGKNTAGILGKIFNDSNTKLIINNCYNTGAISGSKESATICGWANKNISISNCYNSGSIKGKAGSDYLFRYNHNGTLSVSNCYDVNGTQTGVTKLASSQVGTGELCSMLNKNNTVFTQDVSTTGTYPIPGTEGLSGFTVLGIADATELLAFADSVNTGKKSYAGSVIYLENDIDLSGVSFSPIGNGDNYFRGTFDGQGHRIKNMTINASTGYLGLFGVVSGTNCVVKNTIIDSSCSVTSTATGKSSSYSGVAGLIGCVAAENNSVCNLTIENCGNEANVSGYNNVAGLLGGVYSDDATVVNVNNCYNTGNISGTSKSESGSIVGYARKHTNISNTYNSGTVGGTTDWLTFAFTGADNFDGTITNCYTTVSGDKTPGVTKITSDFLSTGELCNMLNKTESVFYQVLKTNDYPLPGSYGLLGVDTLHITDAAGLVNLAVNVNNGTNYTGTLVCLDNDIDLSAYTGSSQFPMIGTTSNPFKGTFDGQEHSIKNMTLSYAQGYVGLFGAVSGTSTIKNVVIDSSCSVTSTSGMGVAGLVGSTQAYNGVACNVTIENCGNEATITGLQNAAGILGGVYDFNNNTTISNCYNSGAIAGGKESASICGSARNNYTITNCYNCGTLTGLDNSQYLYRCYEPSSTSSVTNCYDVNGSQTGVTQIAADKVTTGELCNILNNYATAFTQNLGNDLHPMLGTTRMHHSRTMKGQWEAVCLPFAAAATNDYQFYQIDEVGDNVVTLTNVQSLEAGVPAIIYRNSPSTTIDITPNDTTFNFVPVTDFTVNGLTIRGTFTSTDISNLSGYKLEEGILKNISLLNGTDEEYVAVTCKPFRAYFTSDKAEKEDYLFISTDGIVINDSTELRNVATAFNSGTTFSNTYFVLGNDIDMTNVKFTPIGNMEHPFTGLFDGQGYRIKNLTVNGSSDGIGLFGCIAGENTVIMNTVIDSSCSVTATAGSGTAGLVGCVSSTSGSTCNVRIQNCGNEANVTGLKNVAGILGGVYNNDNTQLTITNCYNTGAVNGQSESATLCGYAGKNYNISNSYNAGTVTGAVTSERSFCYTDKTDGTYSLTNCYDVNGAADATLITSDQVRLGDLCNKLNASSTVFAQNLSSETYPVFGTEGLRYTRSMKNHLGTIVLPFDVTISEDDSYHFYQLAAVADTTLTLTQISGTLPAGTPAVILMDDNTLNTTTGNYELSLAANGDVALDIMTPDAVDGLTLTGTYNTLTDMTDIYYIAANKFWYAVEGTTVNPFFAYLNSTLVNGAKSLVINFEDGGDATALEALKTLASGDAKVYDLSGRKLNSLQKGVNIVKFRNGTTQKVILK